MESTNKLNQSCHSSHFAHTTLEPLKLKFEVFKALNFVHDRQATMDPPSSPAFEFLQALRSARNRQATMWAQSVGAVAPFRFLDLPREVRDDIYEAAIFDLSPPDMFMRPQDPDSIRLRKMDTNVLLTSRQVYWESRDVIVRRAHLVMVSIEHRNIDLLEKLLIPLSGITGIDPMYHNFCVMTHRSK